MLEIVMMIAMAVFFHRLADYENMDSPVLWTIMSVALSAIALFVLGWGWLGLIGSQFLLLGGLVVRKIFIERRQAG